MFDLTGKVAIVTGGSRGIGRAASEALAAQGAHVIVNYVRGEAEARALVEAITARGGKAEALGFDVANLQATEAAIADAAKRLGRLDILVANAGISIDGLLLRIKEEDLDRLFAVNVKGSIACARAATKVMMRARTGRIVFLSSVVAEMGNVGQAAYAATKAALLGVTKSLAREYAGRGITVNAVAPGFIDTDMTTTISAEMKEGLTKMVPLGRTGRPEEVAAAISFLCSDEASYVTGETLRVNGGMYV
ncbi:MULTISPECIES: 3-oxoacyl-ACP reductase FabG [Sorangium]|uniref:3-ketoacyl-ACP reductase n=1 Tax=Sorangium cellulosum TaxID=56 RepID=A0A4P2QRJ6_SORCE|nr:MULTISPECIES: 3-oxoacyl-ACP reductase FabG [Sorangium]AUX32668.1 3-ketoacyl-ACP reductase [Sorangium cellulosum]WCQ92044.1 3-oxoacyl-[acyl-carrier-protein] reductase FabG [Sorangium sp. Soce836]